MAGDVDNFAAAFERLSSLGDGDKTNEIAAIIADPEAAAEPATPPAAEPPAPEASETPAADPAPPSGGESADAGDDGATEPTSEELEAPVADPASAEAPKKETDDELLARLAAMVKKTPVEAPAPAAASAPEPEAVPIYSEEEQSFLAGYDKDWPDVTRGEALKRKAEYRQLLGYVFQEFAKELAPLSEMVQTLAQRTHLTDLNNAVSDYDAVRDQVVEWVGNQPAYLRQAYEYVINQGTVDEVADLIQRYRAATGTPAPGAAPAAAPKPTPAPTPAAKKAAAGLAPVPAKRTSPAPVAGDVDFETAFATFSQQAANA